MKRFAVIGRSLPHTMSPFIYKELGLDYGVVEMEREELRPFVEKGEFDGFNVTIPYKTEIIPYLDEIRGEASIIGAVNTVVRTDGKTVGYNTDIDGMAAVFDRENVSFAGKTALILGSGGTSLTAERLAVSRGASEVFKVSRTGEINYENCYEKVGNAEIIINATPVGMFPENDLCKLDISRFPRAEFVFDAIYNPLRSRLVQDAARRGIKSRGGLLMLLSQAFAAYELYTGKVPTEAEKETASEKLAAHLGNLVLIGMPSCGKSSVGKKLAAKLGKTFIDTDEEVFRLTGRTPAEIIAAEGESAFRQIEADAVFEASKKTCAVIATGGGAVLSEDNVRRLKGNGFLVWLKRDLNSLSSENRPLSKDKGISELYKVREPIYRRVSDVSVENKDGKIEITVEEAAKLYEKNIGY